MEVKLLIENKFNEGFLRKIFNANKTGPITISRNHAIGKFMNAMVKYSNLPVKQTAGTTLIMPDYPECTGTNKYLYYTIEDQSKINDFISAIFSVWFDRVLLEGIHKLNLNRRSITDIIISQLNLEQNSENDQRIFERIRKYEYRSRLKAMENLVSSLESFEL